MTGRLNTDLKTILRFGHHHSNFKLSFDEGCITLDTSGTTLFPLEARSLSHQQKEVQFTLVMDNSSLELFVHGLDKTITTRVYFDEALLDIEIDSQTMHNLTLKELSK
jgi:sucrose-6-phosphate hydrolase SacC (GH32 family)